MNEGKLRKVGKGERRIWGVCGGISRYIDPELDPVIMRLFFIMLAFFSPAILILYAGLALALNTHEEKFDPNKWEKDQSESISVLEVKIKGKNVKN